MEIFNWIIKRKKPEKIRVEVAKDIDRKLRKDIYWCGYSKKYREGQKIYRYDWPYSELTPTINGKKVKFWLQVRVADDDIGDYYVPIFYKRKK